MPVCFNAVVNLKPSCSLGLLLLSIAVLLISGCATQKAKQDGSKEPIIDVYLIPMDDFSFQESTKIADELSRDTGLRIKSTLNMGSAGFMPFPGTRQYSSDQYIEATQRVRKNLPDTGPETAFVVLTQRDINTPDRSLRFTFAVHVKAYKTAVLSSARLVLGKENGAMADIEIIHRRVVKMVKRQIGDVYYGYQRSTDISEIMYSPIMSLDDVDRMGWKYPQPH
jgi:predicted Zn-dependent protease